MDKDILNAFFARMDRKLIIDDTTFIMYKHCKDTLLEKGNRLKIQVEILGIKISPNKTVSPVLRIINEQSYY